MIELEFNELVSTFLLRYYSLGMGDFKCGKYFYSLIPKIFGKNDNLLYIEIKKPLPNSIGFQVEFLNSYSSIKKIIYDNIKNN